MFTAKLLLCFYNTVTSEEVQRLYKRFVKLDKDNSGAIDKDEFLSIPGINNNPLAQRYSSNEGHFIRLNKFDG